MMDSSASSDELEMTLGSTGVAPLDHDSSFEVSFEGSPPHQPKTHSPFALRSQCANSQCCPHGKGILFRSRISPSPARKTRLRSRRRRRSDQSRLDVTDSTTSTTLGSTLLDVSNADYSHLAHVQEPQYQTGSQEITVSLGHTFHHPRDDEALRRSLTPKKKKKEVRYEDEELSRLFSSNKNDQEFNRLLASHKNEQEFNRLLASNITTITSLSHSQETSQVDFRMNENNLIGSGINSVFIAPTDTVVSSTPTKAKPSTVTDSSESGFEEGVSDKTTKSSASEHFIPGSTFFAQFRTPPNQGYSSTSDYFTDFTGTDTPSKLRESTRRLSVRKPFNPYIAYSSDEELEEWMKNPKTDYTYSESLTYRKRVTPERKVGSPNMSRKGLRGNIDYNKSSDFSDHSFSIESNNYGKSYQNFRSSGLHMDALSDSESESPPVATRTRASRSASIDHRPNSNGSIITTVTKSNYTTTRKTFLDGGLDEESDEEVKVPLPSLRFRTGTPLTASRRGTPLARGSTPLFTSNKNETNTRHYTSTLLSTPEEEEKSLYRKIVGVPGAACRTVVTSSKWAFSYIVTSVILMATRTATYLSSSRSSSTTADKFSSTTTADKFSSTTADTFSSTTADKFSSTTTADTFSSTTADKFSSTTTADKFFSTTIADKLTSIADANSSHITSSTKSESAFDRFITTVTTVITTITTTTTEEILDSTSGSLESVTTKVKRRPRLLFWIPLLLLLLLIAYWWLFLAPATSDDEGETQSLGYLLSLPFIKLYDLSLWLALSAYDGLLLTATKIYDLTLWLTFSTYNRIVWLASSSPEALITAPSYAYNTLNSVLSTVFNSTSKSVIAFRDNAYIYSSEAINYLWLGTQNYFSYFSETINYLWHGTQNIFSYSSDTINYLWHGTQNIFSYSSEKINYLWLGTQNIFSYLWLSSLSILNWCWSLILNCLAYLLDLFYFIHGTLQSIGLSLYGVLLSSASVFSTSPNSSASSNDTLTDTTTTLGVESQTDSTSWLSFAGVTHSTSEMIIGTSEGLRQAAITSQDWIWSAWVWIIASVGKTVSDVSGYTISAIKSMSSNGFGFLDTFLSLTSWGFLSLWSLLGYLWTGLWSGLVYLLTSLWTFFTSFTFTVAEFATGTADVLTNTIKLISIPTIGYFKTSSVNEATPPVITPPLDTYPAAPQVTMENMVEEIVKKVLDSSRLQDKLQQLIDTHNKEEDVSALVRSVIEQEVSLVRAETTVLKKEVAIITSDSDQILGLKDQQAALVKQLDMLAAAVENTSGNAEKQQQFNDQLGGLRDQINILSQQLHNLQDAHANLESEVSTCCKRASLTLADVERHVTTLLGDILGFSVGDDNTAGVSGEKPSMATASDLNAWLKSYFVAKHELEARLTALADSMEKATLNVDKETMEQTTQMVMETVMDKIRGEIRLQYEQLSSESKETLSEQVKEHVKEQLEGNLKVQVEAAVEKLKEQVALDVKEQVTISKQELGSSLNAEVASIIAESVPREISAAVPLVVSSAVSGAIASHINGVVEKVIEEAVESSVKTVVSKEISSVLPDAIEEKISSTLPDIVAVTLPDMVNVAVNTTINETVMKAADIAVAAAVEIQLNKGEKIKETIQSDDANSNSGIITANISYSQSNGKNSSFGVLTASGLNETEVQRIVKDALTMYDADKTGMVDHALESAGGNIISTRCTEGYQVHQAEVSILGWPIYRYSINNPRTIIQPDVMPGQCWAFKGSQGYIVIQLAGPVRPTGFTMEHIPKTLSPSGSIDSAPREFSVWGLESENGEEVELGNYEFLHDGESLQYFTVKEGTIPDHYYFPIVELKIKSNHGNMKYTCLYRFRVHGVRYF